MLATSPRSLASRDTHAISKRTPIGIGVTVSPSVKVLEIEFTPDEAKQIVAERVHPKQRNLNIERARTYLRAMQDNDWHEPPFTFDSIAFDQDGLLVNGLHRMKALSMHTKPIRFMVMFGVRSPEEMPLPEGDNGMLRKGYFVAGANKEDWEVASFITEVLAGQYKPRNVILRVHDHIHPTCQALFGTRKKAHPATIRSAFVVHYFANEDPALLPQLHEQWEAFATFDTNVLWPSLRAWWEQLKKGGSARKREMRFSHYARTMSALENPQKTRIHQSDKYAVTMMAKAFGHIVRQEE